VQCLVLSVLDLEPENPETTPTCLVSHQAADINCTGSLNVVDVQLAVQIVLGALVDENGMPSTQDLDLDNVHNDCDSCPTVTNPLQADNDGVWGGAAKMDDCEVCDDNLMNDNTTCDAPCVPKTCDQMGYPCGECAESGLYYPNCLYPNPSAWYDSVGDGCGGSQLCTTQGYSGECHAGGTCGDDVCNGPESYCGICSKDCGWCDDDWW